MGLVFTCYYVFQHENEIDTIWLVPACLNHFFGLGLKTEYTAQQCFDEKFFQTKSLMTGVI